MLQCLDTTEDRNFSEGETVFDVDGNAYVVHRGYAELKANRQLLHKLAAEMRNCFSRKNPKAKPTAQFTPGPWQIKDDYTREGRLTVIAEVDENPTSIRRIGPIRRATSETGSLR